MFFIIIEIAKVLETTHPGSPTPLVKPNRILNVKLRKNRQHSKGRRGSHEQRTMDFFRLLDLLKQIGSHGMPDDHGGFFKLIDNGK